jgi:outer membrane murein-binding lipoprotein Lpp
LELLTLKKITIAALIISTFAVVGCSSQNKQDLKQGLTEVGQATRDATKATGHFFRDTTKDVISNVKQATSD